MTVVKVLYCVDCNRLVDVGKHGECSICGGFSLIRKYGRRCVICGEYADTEDIMVGGCFHVQCLENRKAKEAKDV